MAQQRFDAALKALVQTYPQDWLAQLSGAAPAGPVEVLTPDLSSVSAFADLVLKAGGELHHIDFQSGPDRTVASRALKYNVLLYERYELPVESTVVLLHARANLSSLTGELTYQTRNARVIFGYNVFRVWERPAEVWLQGGLGVVPLAGLGALPEGAKWPEALPGIVRRAVERIERETAGEPAARLLAASFIQTGLKYPRDEVRGWYRGVTKMRESDTYMAILEEGEAKGRIEGRTEEARNFVLRLGGKKLGEPDAETRSALEAITDVSRLERMGDRILDANNWQEILNTP
ncbi:MAG TPA: hypothetical protein VIL46_07505 [Gemmataceae bacterium]